MYAVEMKGILKQYPSVKAVDGANFILEKGEIHSLLGENGAGKSTLMKILYGMTQPDEGIIKIQGQEVKITNPKQAIELGIGMVHQHFMLVPVMTVIENIIVGSEPKKGLFVDYKKAEKRVHEMIEKYAFNISPSAKVETLSVGEQQRVEILKALYRGADILILDEPTAVLAPQEVEELFKIMRELKKEGKSILIITHKLKETMAIADSISVLRDGKMVENGKSIRRTTVDDLAKMMVGRDVHLGITRRSQCMGDDYFKVENLTVAEKDKKILDNINLTIRKGEILGIAGIEGNGQTELIEVLTGLRKPDTMRLTKGEQVIRGDAKAFIAQGIGHIPEDRMTRGLVLDMTIEENVILGYHTRKSFIKRGLFKAAQVRKYAESKAKEYGVKTPTVEERCGALSGGNQQKVVIARVFSQNPDVIIVAQPTRGVDVGAMEYIHSRLLELRDEGKAILLISADLDEVRCLSDKLAIIYNGQIVQQAGPEELTETELGLLMTGSTLKEGAWAHEKM